MLQSLSVKFYQSHKNSTFNFSPGVNTIIGVTDSGKTAILRALKWVLTNRPTGTEFVSGFISPKECTDVTLVTTENQKISRKRNKQSVNSYTINDGEPYVAFGAGAPPDEVTEITRIGDINISSQLDAPFLLSVSSGEVARYFNQIAGLDKIGSALSHMSGTIAETRKNIKIQEADLTKLDDDLKAFETLPAMEASIVELELLEKQHIEVLGKAADIISILTAIEDLTKEQTGVLHWLEVEPISIALGEKISVQIAAQSGVDTLYSAVSGIRLLEASLAESARWLSVETVHDELKLQAVDYAILHSGIGVLSNVVEDIIELTNSQIIYPVGFEDNVFSALTLTIQQHAESVIKGDLSILLAEIETLCDQQDDIVDEIVEAEKLYSSMLPDECPLCGKSNE